MVEALAVGPDGSLYTGGSFTTAGGVPANRIARWDGAQWHPLGSGISGGEGWPGVFAMAFGPDGSLYAGGVFTTAGGVAANYTARWDGAQWNSLGSGMDHSVSALAVGPDGSLYAGGRFTTAGGVAANGIARWDGAQWHPLDSGMNDSVDALAIGPDGSLYAGGWFTTAGEVAANRIARWDGAQWHPVSVFSGNGMDGLVCALALEPGRLALRRGVLPHSWPGCSQQHRPLGRHPVASPGQREGHDTICELAVGLDGSLYAGGSPHLASRIARWDGSQWHPPG